MEMNAFHAATCDALLAATTLTMLEDLASEPQCGAFSLGDTLHAAKTPLDDDEEDEDDEDDDLVDEDDELEDDDDDLDEDDDEDLDDDEDDEDDDEELEDDDDPKPLRVTTRV